jgi:hypothetical protein
MKSTASTIIAACLVGAVLAQDTPAAIPTNELKIYDGPFSGPRFTCTHFGGTGSGTGAARRIRSSKGKKGSSPVGDWRVRVGYMMSEGYFSGSGDAEMCKPGKATLGKHFVEEGDAPVAFDTESDCEDYITYLWCVCGMPELPKLPDFETNQPKPTLVTQSTWPLDDIAKTTEALQTTAEVPTATVDDIAVDTATKVPATEVPKVTVDDIDTEVPTATVDDIATTTEIPDATTDDTSVTPDRRRGDSGSGNGRTGPQSQCYDPRHRGGKGGKFGKGGKSLRMRIAAASATDVAGVSGAVAGLGFVVAAAVLAIKRRSRATASAEDAADEATEQTPILADTLVTIA